MDTIEIAIRLNNELKEIEVIKKLINEIESLRSPYGNTFCNVLEISRTNNIIVKVSYPRFYEGTNAFLITRRSQCFFVQKYLTNKILKYYEKEGIIESIRLNRVDISFTYYTSRNEKFSSYKNIFYIFAHVYSRKIGKAIPKAYLNMLENEFETIIFSPDNCSGKNYNSRLEIYNQYLNLERKLGKRYFERVNEIYEDLPLRIRMEVSKRIRLTHPFTVEEFARFDILGNYFESYKRYILDNILDFDEIERVYWYYTEELINKLKKERDDRRIDYERFIYKNKDIILDYEILRRAVKEVVLNPNTRENAITRIRRILRENENRVIVLNTKEVLEDIYNQILDTKLKD